MNNDFRFINEICPVCNKPFTENDDIVVCPLCGTPHHRECYKQNGECFNNDRHSDGYRWESTLNNNNSNVPPINNNTPPHNTQNPNQNEWNNGQNNNPNTATAGFGTPQYNPLNLFPKEVCDGVSTEEAVEFVGASSLKYLQKFFYVKGNKRTFNWAAFLFAPFWFFYRKLNKIGSIFLAVTISMTVIFSILPPVRQFNKDLNQFIIENEQVLNAQSTSAEQSTAMMNGLKNVASKNALGVALLGIRSLVTIGMSLLAGFMGDKWYYDFTVKKIRKIKSETEDINQQKLRFFKEGGIGMALTIVAILGVQTISMLLEMFL